jgi:hypothetical protein
VANRSTPAKRASDGKKQVKRIQRHYKTDLKKRRKLLPGEIEYVDDMTLVLKLAGYTNSQIASAIGISRGQVKEILEKPEVTEKLLALRTRLPQAALDLIQGLMIEAVVTIADVMRTEIDPKWRLQSAFDLLDRGGVTKASRQERHNINEDRTTFTDDGIVEKLRAASPEVQEEAAQIIERLEVLLQVEAETADVGEGEDEA